MSEESDDKQHEPTKKKLEDARKKGEFARSTDLHTAAAYAGFVLLAVSVGGAALIAFGSQMMGLLETPFGGEQRRLGHTTFAASSNQVLAAFPTVILWFAAPAAAVIASIIVQRSLVFAPEKLRPRASRISIISNAKNKFGRTGLFEFAKSAAKLGIYSIILAIVLKSSLPRVMATLHQSPRAGFQSMFQLCLSFLAVVLVVSAAIAAVDMLWQHFDHLRKNRMSQHEVKEEFKQSDGDPHMKQQRRQKGMAIAMNQMMADVPEATVVIVNPTHYAVALKWERASPGAPVCIAKGVDEIAARIREVAAENAVPMHRDPPTARALYASVEIGQEIPQDHFKAVAASIRFAEEMRKIAGGKT